MSDENEEYMIHLLGMKQLLMSERCVIETDWEYLQHSNVVAFLDSDESINGCTLILAHGPQ